MSQKNASEKLDAAIKAYSAAKEEDPNIETYLRRIEGLEELEVNEEAGTAELKIDGQGFFVVLGGNDTQEYDSTNGRIIDGIYVVEIPPEEENQEGEENTEDNNEEGQNEENNKESEEKGSEENSNEQNNNSENEQPQENQE